MANFDVILRQRPNINCFASDIEDNNIVQETKAKSSGKGRNLKFVKEIKFSLQI